MAITIASATAIAGIPFPLPIPFRILRPSRRYYTNPPGGGLPVHPLR